MTVNTDGIKHLPNAFYDMMVFAVPTVQFAIGIWFGCGHPNFIKDLASSLDTPSIAITSVVIIFVVGIVASYEYGRLVDALSAYLVQGVLKIIVKDNNKYLSKLFKHRADFCQEIEDIYDVLELDPYNNRKGDKWVIYFYAFAKHPAIGADLLKRYAWEKLSRSSAFNYAILLIISLACLIKRICQSFTIESSFGNTIATIFDFIKNDFLIVEFGSLLYTTACLFMVSLTYLEYYRRNVWNHDLLLKMMPVLKKEFQRKTSGRTLKFSLF